MKILWNLLCRYNNIYASSYKYLKEKKSTNQWLEKKKIYIYIYLYIYIATVVTVSIEQTKRHYSNAQAS